MRLKLLARRGLARLPALPTSAQQAAVVTVAAAKQVLARRFGVREDQVRITIEA